MIEVGIALTSIDERSGDRATVVRWPGKILLCAIDGLGHGAAAADAADAAVRVLEDDADAPLRELLQRCHERLRSTRGAVMTIACLDERARRMEWVGVGNVEARLLRSGSVPGARPTEAPVLFGGVVGHNLPAVRSSTLALQPGDVIVMATDGVDADFAGQLRTSGGVQGIADRILGDSGKGDDDALVLVARWLGP